MSLVTTAVQGAVSLAGGFLGNRAQRKAANDAFRYQDELNNNLFNQQRVLQDTQNDRVFGVNQMIEANNAAAARDFSERHEDTTVTETLVSSSVFGGSIDLMGLVRDAEAAGFNPLTVLRGGGLAGYATGYTNSTSFGTNRVQSSVRSREARPYMTYLAPGEIPVHPGAAQGQQAQPNNAWSQAATNFLGAWKGWDSNADQKAALEMGLAEAQIRNLNSDTAANNRRPAMSVPTWTAPSVNYSSGGIGAAGRVTLPSAASGALGTPTTPEQMGTTYTNPWRTGHIDYSLADAAAFEERYGDSEIASMLYGLRNGTNDLMYNLTGKTAGERWAITQDMVKGMKDYYQGLPPIKSLNSAGATGSWSTPGASGAW